MSANKLNARQLAVLSDNTKFCIETGLHGYYRDTMREWANQLEVDLGSDYPAMTALAQIAGSELPYGFYEKSGDGELGVIKVNPVSGEEFIVEMSGDSRIPLFAIDNDGVYMGAFGDDNGIIDVAVYDHARVLLAAQIDTGLIYNPDIL